MTWQVKKIGETLTWNTADHFSGLWYGNSPLNVITDIMFASHLNLVTPGELPLFVFTSTLRQSKTFKSESVTKQAKLDHDRSPR